jgi:putative DNA primase/helicase
MGNHRPTVKSGGHSFWRRLRLIEFNREVPDDKIIDDLQGILADQHGPALLSWIIAGAVAYHQGGLQEPASVKTATESYAHDQDTVARFLEDACHLGGGDQVQVKGAIVRAAYERWCLEVGETPVGTKTLTQALSRAGVGSRRTESTRFYTGLTLLNSSSEEPPEPEDEPDSEWFR